MFITSNLVYSLLFTWIVPNLESFFQTVKPPTELVPIWQRIRLKSQLFDQKLIQTHRLLLSANSGSDVRGRNERLLQNRLVFKRDFDSVVGLVAGINLVVNLIQIVYELAQILAVAIVAGVVIKLIKKVVHFLAKIKVILLRAKSQHISAKVQLLRIFRYLLYYGHLALEHQPKVPIFKTLLELLDQLIANPRHLEWMEKLKPKNIEPNLSVEAVEEPLKLTYDGDKQHQITSASMGHQQQQIGKRLRMVGEALVLIKSELNELASMVWANNSKISTTNQMSNSLLALPPNKPNSIKCSFVESGAPSVGPLINYYVQFNQYNNNYRNGLANLSTNQSDSAHTNMNANDNSTVKYPNLRRVFNVGRFYYHRKARILY